MKVALVHDFLNQIGGAEKVLEVFHEIFPKAPVYTLTYDKDDTHRVFEGYNIRTSFIQKMPFGIKRYKWYLALMPMAIESFDFSNFDVVISDCSAYAKGIVTKPETLHICYCHSPTRYLWSDTHDYTEELKQPTIVKQALPFFLNRIRVWDRLAAERVDKFIANSKNVQKRINKYYKRSSELIYPPVDTKRFKISSRPGDYFLLVSRLRPYKRVDLVIEAFNALELPLKIIGTGEVEKKLKKMAKPNIEFLGNLSDKEKAEYFSRTRAFVHPQEEDFGITLLEAAAAGRPVLAFRKGGALETVKEGITGEFFDEQSPWSLVDLVRNFNEKKYDSELIKQHAAQYDTAVFKKKIENFFAGALKEHHENLEKFKP